MKNQTNEGLLFPNKKIAALLIPLILEQILGVTVGMADTIMVSGAGEAAMSGVSLVDTINTLLVNLFLALSTGGSVTVAQYIGKKRMEQAYHAASQLLLSIVAASGIVMIIALAANRAILRLLFGAVEESVMNHAYIYFLITSLSFPFLAAQFSSQALLRAAGNTKITMQVSLFLNILNVIGNAIFLLVFHMGAAGVALATLVSRIAGTVILLVILFRPKSIIHVERPFSFRFDWSIIKQIMRIGVPTGIDNTIFQFGKILIQSLIVSFGTASIVANAVVGMVAGCAYLPGSAVGIMCVTVIGQSLGAGRVEEAKGYIKKLLCISVVLIAIANAAIYLLLDSITAAYHLSAEASSIAASVILFHCVSSTLLWSLAFVLPNAIRTSGDVNFTMLVSISCMWIFRIGMSYLIGGYLEMGVFGIWIAMAIDWMFRAGLFVWRILSGKWLKHYFL